MLSLYDLHITSSREALAELHETLCQKMGEEGRKRYESCYTLNSFEQSMTEIMMYNIMQADI